MATAQGEAVGAARERQAADHATIARLERLVANTTRRLCFLPRGPVLFDYDDALSVARLAAWKAHRDYRADVGCRWDSWVILKIRLSLKEAFRSFDYGALHNRHGIPAPDFVALDADIRRDQGEDDPPRKLAETLADQRNEAAEVVEALDFRAIVRVLNWLPPREALVLRAYYLEDVTHRVIARRLELSESRVHQLHRQALDRARMMLEGEKIG